MQGGDQVLVDRRVERLLRLLPPGVGDLLGPLVERVVEVAIEGGDDDLAQLARLQGRERVDLGLLQPELVAPPVAAPLGLLQRRARQVERAHLLLGQGDRDHLELKVGEEQVLERLQLAPDRDAICRPLGSKSARMNTIIGRPSAAPVFAIVWSCESVISPLGK